jgi:hypothetical protein
MFQFISKSSSASKIDICLAFTKVLFWYFFSNLFISSLGINDNKFNQLNQIILSIITSFSQILSIFIVQIFFHKNLLIYFVFVFII